MGLLAGPVSCIRFNVTAMPEEMDFNLFPFHGIQPGSSLRERAGFTPFQVDGDFELSHDRWAFRVRIDKVMIDTTTLKERLRELIKIEEDAVGPPSPAQRRKLRQLAEDEQMQHPATRSKIIECVMDRSQLLIGSTSKAHVGTVLELLKRIGVEVDFKTPWLDEGQEEPPSDLVDLKEPGQSLWGCHFLRKLVADPDVMVEPEKGSVRLVTSEGAKVSLTGPVVGEVEHFLESGCEIVAAKLMFEKFQFTFDGLSYRIASLKLDNYKSLHWIEALENRLELTRELWGMLDQKYRKLVLEAP